MMALKYCYCQSDDWDYSIECCGVPVKKPELCPGSRWFHFKCLNFDQALCEKYIKKFYCRDCCLKYNRKITYYKKYESIMTDDFKELRTVVQEASSARDSLPLNVVNNSQRVEAAAIEEQRESPSNVGVNDKASGSNERSNENEKENLNEDNGDDDQGDSSESDNEISEDGSSSESDNENSDEEDESDDDGDSSESDNEGSDKEDEDDNNENSSPGDNENSGEGNENDNNEDSSPGDNENSNRQKENTGDTNRGNVAGTSRSSRNDWFRVDKLVKLGWHDDTDERMWLVRWEGYSSKDDTWIPESHLGSCKQMVDEELKKLNLPLSNLRPVHGCNVRDKTIPVNIANWVTSARVLEIIRMYKSVPQYKSDVPIIDLDDKVLDKLPTQDTVYLVSLESHLYVIYCQVSRKCAWISDGLGLAFKKPHIVPILSRRMKVKLRPVDCNLQKRADHCGASAAAIALEMIRQLKDPQAVLSQVICFPHSTYEKIVDRMHKRPSASHSGWQSIHTQETRRFCTSCNSFSVSKNADRRILFMHQRKCQGFKRT